MGTQYLERHAHLTRASAAPHPLLALIGATAVGALALAWVLQHRFDYQPCPWCVLQRLLVCAVVLSAGVGVLVPGRVAPLAASALTGLLSFTGVAVALYQHLVAAKSASCNLTIADRIMSRSGLADAWPAMFDATARCDEADRPWLGVPFSLWGATLFAILGVCALMALHRGWRQRARARSAIFY